MSAFLKQNPFTVPLLIRKMIRDHVRVKVDWQFTGKAFICALVNTKCPIGCTHCMFATIPDMEDDPWQRLDHRRVSKLLQFVEESNAGYFLVSSAGEAFLDLNEMYEIAKESRADFTWMATSGFWAQRKDNAVSILDNLYTAFCKRQKERSYRRLFLRISLDSFHVEKLARSDSERIEYLMNIVSLFDQHYSTAQGFYLMLHALEGEEWLVKELADVLGANLVSTQHAELMNASIHPVGFHKSVKVTESAIAMQLPSGYCIEITFAKRLLSDLSAPLHDLQFKRRLEIFDRDAFINEGGNPAIKYNNDGSFGPNILVSFNGNVSIWQSEMPDVDLNIDHYNFEEIMATMLSDPGVLATIENGLQYRFDVVGEVNPKAVLQSKAVNIRDYTSRVLLEEDRTKLYYTLRVLREYVERGRIDDEQRREWPSMLNSIVELEISDLQELYHTSGYDIIKQMIDKENGNFRVFINLLNMTSTQNIRITVNEALKQGLISNRGLLERCHTLFRRIARGWYDLDSISDTVREGADEIAAEFGDYVEKKWRGYNRVEAPK
jgi:hypothetical protein